MSFAKAHRINRINTCLRLAPFGMILLALVLSILRPERAAMIVTICLVGAPVFVLLSFVNYADLLMRPKAANSLRYRVLTGVGVLFLIANCAAIIASLFALVPGWCLVVALPLSGIALLMTVVGGLGVLRSEDSRHSLMGLWAMTVGR